MADRGARDPRSHQRGIGARFLKQTSSLPGYVFVSMNTISMTVNMTAANAEPRVQLRPVNELRADQIRSLFHDAGPVAVRRPLHEPKAKAVARPAWVSALSEGFAEKFLYGLLALSAIAGIACAFLSVLERAQNWPAFNAWVGRLLGE